MPNSSEAKLRANRKSRLKIYELISFSSRKEKRLNELLSFAASETNKSKAQYIIDAIYTQFSRDGITIDMLPSNKFVPPEEVKQPKQCAIYMITQQYVFEEIKDEDNIEIFEDEEEYVTIFPTSNMAKKYIKKRYNSKPYVDRWIYRIYETHIEAFTKVEAMSKYRDIIKEAIEESNRTIENDEEIYKDFLTILNNRYGEPDSVEVVRFEDVND